MVGFTGMVDVALPVSVETKQAWSVAGESVTVKVSSLNIDLVSSLSSNYFSDLVASILRDL